MFEIIKHVQGQEAFDEMSLMLKNDRFLVYEFDHVGETALHWAAKRNRTDFVKLFLTTGARIDQRDLGGRTPLLLAAKHGNL